MAGVVLIGVLTMVFMITRTFADPARLMLPVEASEADYQRLRAAYHLDDPLPIQYGRFISGLGGET